MKFVPKGSINNNSALVQTMAWRRSGDKPLSEPMMVSLPTHICVTRPQWVKSTMRKTLKTEEASSPFCSSKTHNQWLLLTEDLQCWKVLMGFHHNVTLYFSCPCATTTRVWWTMTQVSSRLGWTWVSSTLVWSGASLASRPPSHRPTTLAMRLCLLCGHLTSICAENPVSTSSISSFHWSLMPCWR